MANFDITNLPGLTGTPEGAGIFGQLQSIFGGFESPFLTELEGLLGGAPIQRTPSEEAVIQDLINISGGASAARGLGAPTAGGIAQVVAPELGRQRQQRTSNLLQALGMQAGMRGQDIQGLLGLGGLVMPTPIVQPRQQFDIGGILGGLGGLAGGLGAISGAGGLASIFGPAAPAAAAVCWVAEELYGVDDTRTHLARLYANNHDTPFLRLYARKGEEWASWLKDNPWAKPLVQPIWDGMVLKGARMLKGEVMQHG